MNAGLNILKIFRLDVKDDVIGLLLSFVRMEDIIIRLIHNRRII